MANKFYKVFGLEFTPSLSTRPEDYMGELEVWDRAEQELRDVLDEMYGEGNYQIKEKDGAFYGPKIDIQMKDCLGRQWQMGTIQLDFQLPLRFDLSYIDADGERKTPIIIHRVIYGSLERFIGLITEHFAGAFPLWIAPVQVKVLTISDEYKEYADKITRQLLDKNIRIEVDDRNEKIGYKIREAQVQKVPYMLIIGEKELKDNVISVRSRKDGDIGQMSIDKFIEKVEDEVKNFVL